MAPAGPASLHVARDSPVHRLAPQCKIAAAGLFVLVVVATPREQIWAFALHAGLVAVVVAVARLPPRVVLRRLTIEAPFLAFAGFLPFVAGGEQIGTGALALSVDGLWAAWNIAAKGTLGVATAVTLTGTTPVPELIRGLERLRLPRMIVSIVTFMVRYLEVIAGELTRMKIARESRGHDPRWFGQAGAIAQGAGALFVRSFERGERVHLAMLSRGYDGTMPRLAAAAPGRHWVVAAALPLTGAAVLTGAWFAVA